MNTFARETKQKFKLPLIKNSEHSYQKIIKKTNLKLNNLKGAPNRGFILLIEKDNSEQSKTYVRHIAEHF